MFYEGDLQSGIAEAIRQAKLVACFVRDNKDESALWEDHYLKDGTLSPLLSQKAILLRLQAGSQEAGFLAAIYPTPKIPTLVVIHNGQLKEYLAAGIAKTDFLKRLKGALDDEPVVSVTPTPEGISILTSVDESPRPAPAASSSNAPSNAVEQSRAARELLSERSTPLNQEELEQESAAKGKRETKAAVRKEALEAGASDNSKKAADMKYALIQKKRQQDARDERGRILKRVEDDKAERRAKQLLRKEEAQLQMESEDLQSLKVPETTLSGGGHPSASQAANCAIQVRLFDGSTIRTRFPSKSTLRKDVRSWIDGQRVEDMPYNFKQILIPLPNRTITISEEEESLHALGLTPSTTLILVPVKGYTSAYGNDGYISKGISTGVSLVSQGINLVTGTLGSLLGVVTTARPDAEHERPTPSSIAPASANFRTFEDNRPSPEEQLYNGNTLNFEPRRDSDSKED